MGGLFALGGFSRGGTFGRVTFSRFSKCRIQVVGWLRCFFFGEAIEGLDWVDLLCLDLAGTEDFKRWGCFFDSRRC